MHERNREFETSLDKYELKKMTNKETVTRNISLTFDFVNHLIDNPHLLENLSDNFKLNFIESDFAGVFKSQAEKTNPEIKDEYVKVKNSFEFVKP